MGKVIYGALVLVVTVGTAQPLQSQCPKDKTIASPAEPARWTRLPSTIESRNITVRMKANGTTVTREEKQVIATDSQGRFLMATQEADGSRDFWASDPVAGTRTVWNTLNMQARILIFPTAVPDRESCWRIPLAEQNVARGEAQLGTFWTKCQPAGRQQFSGCEAHGNAVEPPRDNSPVAKVSYEDCLQAMASVIIPEKMSEKDEDLGVETIQGLEAHGCRSTITVPGGTEIKESWRTDVGTVNRHMGFSLRSVDESFVSSMLTSRFTSETIALRFGEPDATMFRPPDNYAIKKVEMHEVPCDQASNPHRDAAALQ